MIDLNDWRLRGQEKYLLKEKLVLKKYAERKTSTDHDHCEFCYIKFSDSIPDAEIIGYTTEDNYRWICNQCFEDFKTMFHWHTGK